MNPEREKEVVSQSAALIAHQSSAKAEEVQDDLRQRAKSSLYFLSRAILGYTDLNPRVHLPMCEFLQGPEKRKLLIVPRGHFKSTIGSIAFPVFTWINDPNQRYVLASETLDLGVKFGKEIRGHFYKNDVFQWIFPDLLPDPASRDFRDNDREFIVNRPDSFADPSLWVCGVGAKIQGHHGTVFGKDDLIGDEAADSRAVMDDAISWDANSDPILEMPERDIMHYIGTPWDLADLYSGVIARLGDSLAKFGWSDGGCGVLDSSGDIRFHERFTHNGLAALEQAMGPYRFSCQYHCNPIHPDVTEFKPEDLRYFNWGDNGDIILPDGRRIPRKAIAWVMSVDLATSRRTGKSKTAIIVSGRAPNGAVIIADYVKKKMPASETIDHIFRLYNLWHCSRVPVETVGFQETIVQWARERGENRGVWIPYTEEKAVGDKDDRIRGLQPFFNARQVFIRKSMTELHAELVTFPRGRDKDLLDALQYAVKYWRRPDDEDEIEEQDREEHEYIAQRDAATGY